MPTISTTEEKPQSLLEQIRTTNKAKKAFRNQMRDDSFIIPEFVPFVELGVEPSNAQFLESPNIVKHIREDRKLTYNHYADCSQKSDKHQPVDIEAQHFMNFAGGETKSMALEQKLINGYDGFGGVHDNLLWHGTAGLTYYTLNNKLIIEAAKNESREQTVLADASVQLSCLAASEKYIAVGEGSPGSHTDADGVSIAVAYIYHIETKRPFNKHLSFHRKGIQSMAFSSDSKYLVTLGVQGDDTVAVWDVSSGQTGTVIASSPIQNQATN